MSSDHLKRVEEEFTRQADTVDKYAAMAGGNAETRFHAATGAAGDGEILDGAYRPSVKFADMNGPSQVLP